MILWRFKERPETRNDYPCSAFRWIFVIEKWCIGFVYQYKPKDTGVWISNHTPQYLMSISRNFRLGSEHFYYDGSNCFFSLGWIGFNWSGTNCKKCMPDETDITLKQLAKIIERNKL